MSIIEAQKTRDFQFDCSDKIKVNLILKILFTGNQIINS